MLDLEVIPERSLGCPEKWEFILGKNSVLFSLSGTKQQKKIVYDVLVFQGCIFLKPLRSSKRKWGQLRTFKFFIANM